MENRFAPYECQFTAEDRKQFIAESITQLRKRSGLSQKEVASLLGVTQATYSTYERGRTEPQAEILVRLSYLFKVPVDIIVQTDRTAKTREDTQAQIDDLRQHMANLEEIKDSIPEQMQGVMGELSALLNQVEKLNNSGALK